MAPTPVSSSSGRAYLPGLDGVRAIAVALVCAFHFLVPHAQGGFLGVDLFFCVSGYLITSQLWQRWRDAPVTLGWFWLGRIRRLVPALGALLAVVTLAMMAAGRDQIRSYALDVLAALTYTSNWWYVVADRSYAAEWQLGRPPVLQHLWSLAVEEQFYLLWPLGVAAAVIALRGRDGRHRRLAVGALALALLSALGMGVGSWLAHTPNWAAGVDPARFYYGTDTHACGLFLGAALAFWRDGRGFGPSGAGERPPGLRPAPHLLTAAGVAALSVIAVATVAGDYHSPWLYRWGFTLVAVAGTALVAASTRPGRLADVLSARTLRYLGKRSYSIYLWHWPVVAFTRPVDLGLTGAAGWWSSFLLRITWTLLLAELCYRFVETPIRRHGWRWLFDGIAARHWWGPVAAPVCGLVVALTILAIGLPDKPVEKALQPDLTGVTFHPVVAATPHTPTALTGPGGYTVPPLAPPAATLSQPQHLVYFGDSFALGAQGGLREVFGAVDVYAKVSEQAEDVLAAMRAKNAVTADVVMLHTGNNGLIHEADLRATLDAYATARRVVVVQPHVPRPWQDENRATVERVCGTPDRPRIANVRVLDWHAAAATHPELFVADGVHPSAPGVATYTELAQVAATRP